VTAVVDTIVEQNVALPGVNGDAATAAAFAGHWTERTKSAGRPVQGQRVYEVERVIPARPAGGRSRRADTGDREILVAWFNAFSAESGEGGCLPRTPTRWSIVAFGRVSSGCGRTAGPSRWPA
jgi:hypothetical protein